MSDMDEGDTPYVGWWCKCGMEGLKGVSDTCPNCEADWLTTLRRRSPYDGGPKMQSNPAIETQRKQKREARAEAERREVRIYYLNHKGKRGYRKILPTKQWFGKTQWHTKEQWLLNAYDIDKKAMRTFAIKDILSWRVE